MFVNDIHDFNVTQNENDFDALVLNSVFKNVGFGSA